MFKPVHLLVFVSFAAVGASASPPVGGSARVHLASGPQCFRASSVSDYRAGSAGVVQVRADGNRWFEFRLSAGCPNFSWLMKIGIRPRESLWLCEGKADELFADDSDGRCFISDIRELASGAPGAG
jgi:hypothetical protein